VLSVEKRSNEHSQFSLFFVYKGLKVSHMKAEKKRGGTKAQIRVMKEKERRMATAIFLATILLVVVFSAYFAYTLLTQSSDQGLTESSSQLKPENPNSQLKAAIVDQLSLTIPNETFREEAAAILVKANYTVDYFSGEKVSVEFYRNLATHDYGLIILRVHSSAAALEGKEYVEAPVCFFTSEDYSSTKHVWEQLTDQLVIASYSMPQPPYYFGITPKFVATSMNGKFQNTTVVMMGCEGLNNTKMADAFIQKGAKVYISWSQQVSASHTDQATICLLQCLIIEKQTIKQAVENTMKEVEPDPAEDSVLSYYPLEAGAQTI
jgi:hypothetical protein